MFARGIGVRWCRLCLIALSTSDSSQNARRMEAGRVQRSGPHIRTECHERSNGMAQRRKTSSARGRSRRAKRSKTSRRTIIEPHKGDRRYVRRSKTGRFKKEVNVSRSLAADRRRKAKTRVRKGQGDRGDTGGNGGIIEAVKNAFGG